jgi:hypothetical protein
MESQAEPSRHLGLPVTAPGVGGPLSGSGFPGAAEALQSLRPVLSPGHRATARFGWARDQRPYPSWQRRAGSGPPSATGTGFPGSVAWLDGTRSDPHHDERPGYSYAACGSARSGRQISSWRSLFNVRRRTHRRQPLPRTATTRSTHGSGSDGRRRRRSHIEQRRPWTHANQMLWAGLWQQPGRQCSPCPRCSPTCWRRVCRRPRRPPCPGRCRGLDRAVGGGRARAHRGRGGMTRGSIAILYRFRDFVGSYFF